MSGIKLTIAKLRKEKGITQSQLAEYLGISFQSVSKWENGTTMPDINLLPKLSEYFQVSVDQILGIKPLSNREYRSRKTDSGEHWDDKLDYLKKSRIGFWNNDYLEFLVSKVWKIIEPIDIIDFGCGYGYLGMVLLPILPKGSTYTGVDISDTLLEEAKSIFKYSKYVTKFIKSDVKDFNVHEKYDMAICQAFLRHLTKPKDTLKKMVDSVIAGGMVVCIEVNRELENAGLYIKGTKYNPANKTTIMKKLWKTELESEGRDYFIGMKIPFYMQEYGLRNIDVRLNDKVNFINPYSDKYLVEAFMKSNNWNKKLSDDHKENIIKLFMNRGLSRAEAEVYVESEEVIRKYFIENYDNVFAIKAFGLLISYGVK
ncbi:helix-turn-helix domain-containing protein [Dethiothermospora halolimnae]|uniref:helix-turn-helix domain-containing protein n=1 Tax=Dethiothermospora halolimnae TaxID=3114390 RepID=UPI003CCBB6E9